MGAGESKGGGSSWVGSAIRQVKRTSHTEVERRDVMLRSLSIILKAIQGRI